MQCAHQPALVIWAETACQMENFAVLLLSLVAKYLPCTLRDAVDALPETCWGSVPGPAEAPHCMNKEERNIAFTERKAAGVQLKRTNLSVATQAGFCRRMHKIVAHLHAPLADGRIFQDNVQERNCQSLLATIVFNSGSFCWEC